ncbi:hypothetical protein U1Q18_021871 [Sarracenia purpurea var. burkii]
MARNHLRLPVVVLVTTILTAIIVQADQITVIYGGRSNDGSKQTYASTDSPPWDLLKRLLAVDIHGGGLQLDLHVFNQYLLPKPTESQKRAIGSSNGLNITVKDVDTGGSL